MPKGKGVTSSLCPRTPASSYSRCKSPTWSGSRDCRPRFRSSSGPAGPIRVPRWPRPRRSTTTCDCCLRAWARPTATNAGVRSRSRPPRRSWTGCSACPRACVWRCWRPGCGVARASTATCWRPSSARGSCACAWTARSWKPARCASSTRNARTRSRWWWTASWSSRAWRPGSRIRWRPRFAWAKAS